MSPQTVLITVFLGLGILSLLGLRSNHRKRLLSLYSRTSDAPEAQDKQGCVSDLQSEPVAGSSAEERILTLASLGDRLGRAGLVTSSERKAFYQVSLLVSATVIVGCSIVGFQNKGAVGFFLGSLIAAYLCLVAVLYYLRFCRIDFEREILFQMPITLESMVLLVESGLGILPAIEQLVKMQERQGQRNPVGRILGLVYRIAAGGIPFSQALEMVASSIEIRAVRHVLLHLDVSSAEGGRLVPALRSLSDHAHQEWKLGVETRVRRLENLVVFPVFISVMGLMLLTAAVPIVPLVEFAKSLSAENLNSAEASKEQVIR